MHHQAARGKVTVRPGVGTGMRHASVPVCRFGNGNLQTEEPQVSDAVGNHYAAVDRHTFAEHRPNNKCRLFVAGHLDLEIAAGPRTVRMPIGAALHGDSRSRLDRSAAAPGGFDIPGRILAAAVLGPSVRCDEIFGSVTGTGEQHRKNGRQSSEIQAAHRGLNQRCTVKTFAANAGPQRRLCNACFAAGRKLPSVRLHKEKHLNAPAGALPREPPRPGLR